jgi:MoaA/NifB/PqqE/SkfB family radical SAM enzyme
MKAKLVEGAPGGKRLKLAEVVPLSSPLLIEFHPTSSCNFKCNYCGKSSHMFISLKPYLDYDLYKKGIDELAGFDKKVCLKFAGTGEPLLHPQIIDMINYASGKVSKMEMSTNGSMLIKHIAENLGNLDRLVISIQGTSSEKYKAMCGANINFDDFIEGIKYFYKVKGKTHLHIKIIDIALEGKEDKQKFFNIFGDICDTIGIEHAFPLYPALEINEKLLKSKVSQFGLPINKAKIICPYPFYMMHITPDGWVQHCCNPNLDYPPGYLDQETLPEIWSGKGMNSTRYMLASVGTCAGCLINKYRVFPEDNLISERKRLMRYYGDAWGFGK